MYVLPLQNSERLSTPYDEGLTKEEDPAEVEGGPTLLVVVVLCVGGVVNGMRAISNIFNN